MKKWIINKPNYLLCLCLYVCLLTFGQSQVKYNHQQQFCPSMMSIFGNNQCNLSPTPTKLAIATVTRFRATGQNDLKQGIQFFKQYLTKYATMECDVFDSIYLIWNNDKAPEEYPMLLDGKEKWRKNVYFIQTRFNSMDHRFAFPPWVPEEVFMSLDDDADIDCENMRKSFTQWQDHFIGGLGPFGAVQMSSRTMEYKISQDKFEYKYGTRSYISMALPNIGIIPRHFYDLYYANLPQFEKMRTLVSQLSNCDDIGLNFMIGYIYPQIRPIALKDITANTKSFKIQINKTPTHGQKRNDCLNRFSQILGQNTWSYSVIDRNVEYERIKEDPLRKYECILALKRSIIQQRYLNSDHYYNFMKDIYYYNYTQLSHQLINEINSDKFVFSLTEDVRKDLVSSKKIDLRYRPRHGIEEMFGKQVGGSGGQTMGDNSLQFRDYREIKQQNKVLVSNINALQDELQSLKTTILISNTLVILFIILIIVIFKLIQIYRSRNSHKKSGQMKLDTFSTQLQSTGQTARITEIK